jgi:hypothetical protein
MLKKTWIYYSTDWSLAAVLMAAWCWHAFRLIFIHLEWYDWVAYALPAANWVERGGLSTPQLGPQFHFDRTWLFNSALMGAGPAPFFWALGTGRVSYLVGVATFALANFAAYIWVIRRALKLQSLALSIFCALAFVEHRVYTAHYANQRYDLIAFGAMLLAFAPITSAAGRTPAWRWACAGILPLLHPGLVPASGLWLATSVFLDSARHRASPDVPRPRRLVGPILFAIAWGAAACWYGRAEGLQSQFLPHMRFHSARVASGSISGRIFDTASVPPFSIPSHATTLLISVTAIGLLVTALVRKPSRVPIRVVIPAVLIAGVLVMDFLRGFSYWAFYLLGLGPCLLFAFGAADRPRRIALAALITLAAAHTAVSLRLDRTAAAELAGQREAIAFLVEQTPPGEEIVVGPPFVLASAPRFLPGGRQVLRVVPQPFFLLEFDRDLYRADIAAHTSTYIGNPRWFTQATMAGGGGVGRESAPLFEDAEFREAHFFGEPVIIARRRNGPSHP